MIVPTPGIGFASPSSTDLSGGGSGGLIGIVLEAARSDLLANWIPGNRYTVLLISNMRILPEVPLLVGGGGPNSLDAMALQVSDAGKVAQLKAAMSGGGLAPSIADLGGAWVVVDFLQGGLPVIRSGSGLVSPRTATAKIPNYAPDPDSDSTATPGIVQDIADAARGAMDEMLESEAAEDEMAEDEDADLYYDGLPRELRLEIQIPARSFADEIDEENFENDYCEGFRDGIRDGYRLGVVKTENELRGSEAGFAYEVSPSDEPDAEKRKQWSWYVEGYNAGSDKASKYRQGQSTVSPTTTPDQVDESPEISPADSADGNNVSATGKGAARYIEAGGTRIVLRNDGSVVIDTRDGGGAVFVQAGASGVRLLASGAEMRVGDGGKTVGITADEQSVSGTVAAADYKAGGTSGSSAIAAIVGTDGSGRPVTLTIESKGGIVTNLTVV